MTRGSTGPEWGQLYRAEAPQCHLSKVCRYTHSVLQCDMLIERFIILAKTSVAHSYNYMNMMNMIHKKTDRASNTHTKTHRSFQPPHPTHNYKKITLHYRKCGTVTTRARLLVLWTCM